MRDEDFNAAQLLDGRTVRIRPISPSDGEALVHFHEGLTNETTRLPFFIPHPHLTPGRPSASPRSTIRSPWQSLTCPKAVTFGPAGKDRAGS